MVKVNQNKRVMKTAGIVIAIVGVIIAGIGFYQQSQDNEILEVGKLELKKDNTENINMMMIAGVIITVGGVVVALVGRKK